MDLLDQLDEQKYPENLNIAEIRNERYGKWERMFDKYKERSKKRQHSISLDEFDLNFPNTNRELVENPHTKTFRKFLRQQGDLIDELTTVAGDPASDEEELDLTESESEDECEDFSNVIGYYDCPKLDQGENDANDAQKAGDCENNIDSNKIEFREERINTQNETIHLSLSDNADNDDFIYSAGNPKYSDSNPKPEDDIHKMSSTIETSKSDKRSQANLEDISMNDSHNSLSVIDGNREESLENDTEPFISKYFCRMTCIECRQEVTTVLNMEEESSFKCDACWLDYDHGCDVNKDCEECRELALWLHTRWDVLRRISQGELDGGGTNEKSDGELEEAGMNEKSVPTGYLEELVGGGTLEKIAVTDELDDGGRNDKTYGSEGDNGDSLKSVKDCLTCTECGAATEVPEVMEDSSSFKCDDCLLGYQHGCDISQDCHGCDISQDCHQCRDIVVWVQARREVVKKLKGGFFDQTGLPVNGEEQIEVEALEDSLESLVLEDANEDATTESTTEESEDEQSLRSVRSDLADEIAESISGTTLGESEVEDEVMMDTTDLMTNDISSNVTCTVPEKSKASKNKMTPIQLNILIPFFEAYPRPTADQKLSLAHQTGLTKQVLQRWFDNRRRPKSSISK